MESIYVAADCVPGTSAKRKKNHAFSVDSFREDRHSHNSAGQENELLKEKIDLLIRRLFGVKSEKLDPGQLELLLSHAEEGTGLGKAEASAPTEAEPIVEKFKATLKDQRKTERAPRFEHTTKRT